MARRKHVEATDEQYESVILHLESGGTKKAACELLGIAYNTKRLDSLINDWLERKERDKLMRAKKRKEAVSDSEAAAIITDYLCGLSLAELSKNYYRSTNIIKYQLNKHGAMLRAQNKHNPLKPDLIPDECMADSFEVGQYVWSAKYNCLAKVLGTYKNAYRIVTLGGEAHRHQAYQPAEELGSLQHLFNLGVNPENLYPNMLSAEEQTYRINEAVKNANKRKS